MSLKEKAAEIFSKIKNEVKVLKGEESKDKVYKSERSFEQEEQTLKAFKEGKKKLFDVNNWSSIPAVVNSNFQVFDQEGKKRLKANVMKGDYISIDLPGPLPIYWVQVVELKEGENFSEFIVSPSEDPTTANHANEEVKHFFHDGSTSTFKIEKTGNSIIAYKIGKNEGINNDKEESGNREVVNTLVAEAGWAAVQKLQWKNFTDYIVGII